MNHPFNANDSHTLGVELELQLVDTQTGELSNAINRILNRVPEQWSESFKPELMQSYCEINTGICHTVGDVERDLSAKLEWAGQTAESMGLQFLWAGTHPFSDWADQQISPGERYAWLTDRMQDVARQLVCFGLHIHVGVDSGDKAIQMCDRMLRHLPTLLALSANSPLWCGRDTGIMSYRSKLMDALPTAGLPLTMRNWSEYVWLMNHLVDTQFINSVREIWWDVRPHGGFGTVEIRIMDMPRHLNHVLGLVAMTQSLVAAISDQIDKGAYLYDCHPMIAKQNKWHAARFGLDASFVDPDTMLAVPARQTVRRLMELCDPFAERLGCREHLQYISDLLDHGNGAEYQQDVFHRAESDARAVVAALLEGRQDSTVAASRDKAGRSGG